MLKKKAILENGTQYDVMYYFVNNDPRFNLKGKTNEYIDGVYYCIHNFIDFAEEQQIDIINNANLRADLLNSARDVKQYAYGGCGLIYNIDIVCWFCTDQEIEEYKATGTVNGRDPMQIYCAALYHALRWFMHYARKVQTVFDYRIL